jgi:hypothetical protein
MMLEPELRARLERHWEYSGKDEDIAHEVYADDAVLEFPQGGERYEGVENFREWRRQYPADLAFKIRRLDRWGDLVVAENLISYNDAPPMYTVNLIELNADDKIAHERIYIMEGWDAPEWRAPWRSETPADSVTWEQAPTKQGKGRLRE